MVLAALPASAGEDDARSVFDELYKERVTKVSRTPTRTDDVALAGEMLAATKAVDPNKTPKLLTIICSEAAELAMRNPAGYVIALQAADLLEQKVASEKLTAVEIRTEALRRQYGRAQGTARHETGIALVNAMATLAEVHSKKDDNTEAIALLSRARLIARRIGLKTDKMDQRLDCYRDRKRVLLKLDVCARRIENDPNDVDARADMIRLCLVELNNPTRAAKLLTAKVPEPFVTYVPLAAKDPNDWTAGQSYQLAEWYHSLAKEASQAGRPAMLVRARSGYERFLELHKKKDTQAAKAKLTVTAIENELKKTGSEAVTVTEKWAELLKLVDPAKDTVTGKWKVTKTGLELDGQRGSNMLAIPLEVRGNYEIVAEFARTEGTYDIMFTIPVATHNAAVLLSAYGGKYSGLGDIGRRSVNRNETSSECNIRNDKAYKVSILVKCVSKSKAGVLVKLDGKEYFKWTGDPSSLEPPTRARLKNTRQIGIGAYSADVTFRSVKLRLLGDRSTTKKLRD